MPRIKCQCFLEANTQSLEKGQMDLIWGSLARPPREGDIFWALKMGRNSASRDWHGRAFQTGNSVGEGGDI